MVRFSESDKLFEILGVPETATQIEVKAAYRRKLQAYFSYENSACRKKDAIKYLKESERPPPSDLLGEREFSKIRHAYNILSDPKLRCLYADFVASGECICKDAPQPSRHFAPNTADANDIAFFQQTDFGCHILHQAAWLWLKEK